MDVPYEDQSLLDGIRPLNNPNLWPLVAVPLSPEDVEYCKRVGERQASSDRDRHGGSIDRQYGQHIEPKLAGGIGHIGELAYDRYLRFEGLLREGHPCTNGSDPDYRWAKGVADDGKRLAEDSGQDFIHYRDGGSPFDVDIKTRAVRGEGSMDRDWLNRAFTFPHKSLDPTTGRWRVGDKFSNYGYPDFVVLVAYSIRSSIAFVVGAASREAVLAQKPKAIVKPHAEDASLLKSWEEHHLRLAGVVPVERWLGDPLVLGRGSRLRFV